MINKCHIQVSQLNLTKLLNNGYFILFLSICIVILSIMFILSTPDNRHNIIYWINYPPIIIGIISIILFTSQVNMTLSLIELLFIS